MDEVTVNGEYSFQIKTVRRVCYFERVAPNRSWRPIRQWRYYKIKKELNKPAQIRDVAWNGTAIMRAVVLFNQTTEQKQ
jgi:hypothetical protein